MTARTPAAIAARNGTSAGSSSPSHDGQLVVRVRRACRRGRGSASRTPPRPAAASLARTRRRAAPTSAGSEPNAAHADHRVVRVRVHVGDRREVQVDAGAREVGRDRARDGPRQLDVVDDAERAVPGYELPARRLEPGHVAALLVERDEQRRRVARAAHAVSSRSCSAVATFEAKRVTPPSPRSSQGRSHSGPLRPGKLGSRQPAASRSSVSHARRRR